MKYTKGQWSVDGFNTTSVITNINGFTKVCDCHLAGLTGNEALQFLEENKANAKLIASAPELLEALMAIVTKDGMVTTTENKTRALNAIKKATE